MKIPFAWIGMHFPDTDNVTREELHQWIGYPKDINDPNFNNTCAIRLSLALLGASCPNPGKWPIKAGGHKGRAIETSQHKLSNWLVRQLGQPEKFDSGPKAEEAFGNRRGIVPFFSIHGDDRPQGHIAIVSRDRWGSYLRYGNEIDGMATGCYWSAREVWFWALQ